MSEATLPEPRRRVVAGQDEDGRSAVIFDGPATPLAGSAAYPGVSSASYWKDVPQPDLANREDGLVLWREFPLPPGGTRFYTVRIAAGASTEMHTTTSMEYHLVVSGSVVCLLETGEVEVSAGDVLIMRGAAHGWENRSDEDFVSVAVMVSTEPPSA